MTMQSVKICLACKGTGTLQTIRPGHVCRFCKGSGHRDKPPGLLFRVVGGFSNRKTLNKYEIISYILIHETSKYWYTVKDNYELFNKSDVNSNSEFYDNVHLALLAINRRIDKAIQSIEATLDKVLSAFPVTVVDKVYIVTFREEQFHLYYYYVIAHTGKGMKVDEVTISGKKYVYPHTSKPHNPDEPVERWINKDVLLLKMQIKAYAEARLNYLHSAKMKAEDWVRLFEKEHSGKQ
jgi:hypothetical protein